MIDTGVTLGPLHLATPLVAAAGTFGSVVDFEQVAGLDAYGAAVAKSVSGTPWRGRPAPRVAPAGAGMLNGIGIQNPGIDEWVAEVGPRIGGLPIPLWGSAVGTTPGEFAEVAARLEAAGVSAVEVNLSCPNLEEGRIIALDPVLSAAVVGEVREATVLPIGAKLSPNAADIVQIAKAAVDAGADFLTLTNTIRGAAIDISTRRPMLSGAIGGYSGAPLKPISLACVLEVHRAMGDTPIVGCGGVMSGYDVIEYLLAGASAVCLGTIHFAEPKAGRRVLREAVEVAEHLGAATLAELIGGVEPW
jgi:dihydroorotate dehydrogenase (NAD+) catalytic subunit